MLFTKKETTELTIVILILGFIFSFNEWGIEKFDFIIGIKNLIRAIILSAIILLTQVYIEKMIGERWGINVFYSVWKIKSPRYLANLIKTKIYLGIIVPLIISVISNGSLTLPMVGGFSTEDDQLKRTGRRFTRLTEFEEAKIAFAGTIVSLIFVIAFKLLSLTGLPFFEKGMFIAATIAVVNILPLPPLNGIKIFFGNRIFYVLSLSFIVASVSFLYLFPIILSIILASILAVVLTIFYFYYKEYSQ